MPYQMQESGKDEKVRTLQRLLKNDVESKKTNCTFTWHILRDE
jgi:hypothetical protein